MDQKDTAHSDASRHQGSWGLVVRGIEEPAGMPYQYSFVTRPIQLHESLVNADADFKASPLMEQLGFPLKAVPYPSEKGTYYNCAMRMIFCDPDPASSTFLWPTLIDQESGDMLVVRTDGQTLNSVQFEAMYMFVNDNFIKHSNMFQAKPLFGMQEGPAKEGRKRRIVSKLTAEAFNGFFEEYRRHNIQDGRPQFKEVVSPVLLTFGKIDGACGHCFLKGTTEKPLLRCGKCQVRYYCDRTCQKNDWKEHKKVCGMA